MIYHTYRFIPKSECSDYEKTQWSPEIMDWHSWCTIMKLHCQDVIDEHGLQVVDGWEARKRYDEELPKARKCYDQERLRDRLKCTPSPVPHLRLKLGSMEYEAAIDVAIEYRLIPAMPLPPNMKSLGVSLPNAWSWYLYHTALARRYKEWKLRPGVIHNDRLAQIKMGEPL